MYSYDETGKLLPPEIVSDSSHNVLPENDDDNQERTGKESSSLVIRLSARLKEWYQTSGSKTNGPSLRID